MTRRCLQLLAFLFAISAILPAAARGQSTTYVAQLYGAQETPPNKSSSSGYATLVLSADETSAQVTVTTTGLASGITNTHIYGPAAPGVTAAALFAVPPIPSLVWTFAPTGNLSVQDQLNALKSGNLYVSVNTVSYPNGEIRGQFYPTAPPNPTPPPTAPRPDLPSASDAVRFLEQSTFGPRPADVSSVMTSGLKLFLANQFAAPVSDYQNIAYVQNNPPYRLKLRFFTNALNGQDQLRQRVAFALGQTMVVSTTSTAYSGANTLYALQSYQNVLADDALGNFRQLLYDITTNPAMGAYLNMVNNDKPNPALNTQPNENFARELMQLFTVGVFELNADGTFQLDANNQPIPTYGNDEVKAFARAYTGWTYAPPTGGTTRGHNAQNFSAPMVPYAPNHDETAKTLLNGVVLPANQTPQADLNAALDNIFSHPNVGPFIARRLIQHLVTSNPSPGYVSRVASVFNDNGQGVRGDMKAVVTAILLDGEAGLPAGQAAVTDPYFGHLREPALYIMNLVRGFSGNGDLWGVPDLSAQLGQDVFNSPTVFNFYQPDFQLSAPGETFYGPEAQTLTTNTSLARLNFVNTLLYGKISVPTYPVPPTDPVTGLPTVTSVAIDLTPYSALAANPDALVSALDQLFTHGAMSTAMHNTIVTAVKAIPATGTSYAYQRAQTAAYLVATSVQYQVER